MADQPSQLLADTQGCAPGTRVDDFTIAYLISHGMNADIYAVWHHTLKTPLVCKRLRPSDAHDARWRRLLRAEGSALVQLNHPGIVRLIGQKHDQALPYLLLEHVGGKTLRDALIEDGGFAVDVAVRLLQHLCAALSCAHAAGFLHRDLKPSNIIMRNGRPVLLDFGVVWKYVSGRRPPDRSGTPQYLSPEQVMREPLTPATDVYGLGLLLFELLTNARPFRAGDADRHDTRAPLHLRYPQLLEEPLTLRRAGRRGVPRALQEVIMRCLARDPRERFATATELLKTLDQFTRVKIWPGELARADFSPFDEI
jgi:serine/threonine protein kinase